MSTKDCNKPHWFLVYTKPHQEEVAKENLENQKFITFLPRIAIINHSKPLLIEPLFPRYLFVKLNVNLSNWLPVKSTKGVSHIVMFGNQASFIPDKTINLLKSKLDRDFIFYSQNIRRKLKKGDRIHINKGQLTGIDAIFLSYKPRERVRVLLQFMKKSVVADLPKTTISYQKLS